MHLGAIALTTRNRRGKKRRSSVSAARRRNPPVDYRCSVAAQPHRNWLPESLRTHERAGDVLGCLNLLKRISEQEYEAGRRYSVIVGAYLAMANAPRGTAGNGRGYDCVGASDCPKETCICLARTQRFTQAYEAISEAAGRKAHMAINWVVIQDEPCSADHLPALKLGLSALARHFGLTNHGKS